MNEISAFEVNIRGRDWQRIVNHSTRGRAKAEYWRSVTDVWPDIPYTEVRCRRVGPPVSSPQFVRNAAYRGMPHLRCGALVTVSGQRGRVVDHDASANFVVEFDASSTKYARRRLSVHPDEIVFLPAE